MTFSGHPEPPDLAVRARRIARSFGAIRALDGVDLDVPRGAFFALLGANGAGKTTAVRILTGLLRADGGEAQVLGIPITPRPPRQLAARIGVVPDYPPLFAPLTIRENARHVARLRGIARDATDARTTELAATLGLDEHLDTPAAALSQGSAKKAALLLAMLHAPSLLFLDEPFEGIDPLSARAIRTLLTTLRARGVTIFMTSHVLAVVETVATHVAVLRLGRVRDAGPIADVIGTHETLEDAVIQHLGAERPAPALAWYDPS